MWLMFVLEYFPVHDDIVEQRIDYGKCLQTRLGNNVCTISDGDNDTVKYPLQENNRSI